jgi:signal transduction histidine kinase
MPLRGQPIRSIDRFRLPRRTVRLRLTVLFGGLFLVCGAALLAITYLLMVRATSGFIFSSQQGDATVVTRTGGAGSPSAVQIARRVDPGPLALGAPPLTPLDPQQARAQADQLQALAARQHAAELHQLLLQSGIALAGMAVISIALGWLVAGRVLRPLRTITAAVQNISASNLHQRLALDGPDDELQELGNTFDALVGRLETSFQAQRTFTANASHELRTPLARQRTLAQVALADPDATVESLRTAHERVLAAGAQQERLIESLLTLARGQAGIDRNEPLDLAAITEQVLSSRRAEATQRGLDLRADLITAPTTGDPRLIERLIGNLVDNGLRHNVRDGWVDVRTRIVADQAVVSVNNTGPLIPADALDRLFEPFRRIEADRTSQGEGSGLGLSIVQAIADAHGATITTDAKVDGGLDIAVTFPTRTGRAGDLVAASRGSTVPSEATTVPG